MTVAVVIPCRNEQMHIGALLDAIAAQTRVPDALVIVDDQSTDETRRRIADWCGAHPALGARVRVVEGSGRGPGPAMNAGISATNAELIVRLDGHCVPEPQYIERSCRPLDAPEVGVVGGVWRIVPGAPTQMARAIAAVVSHPAGTGGVAYRHADRPGPTQVLVDTVPFGAFRRELWQRLNGYDEGLAANEDYNFNYRVRLSGLKVVLDRQIVATYTARPSLSALWMQYRRYGYWKAEALSQHPGALRWRQLPPALLLLWTTVTTLLTIASLMAGAPAPVRHVSMAAALLYPLALAGLGAHVALTRQTSITSAIGAMAAVHTAWSLGFSMRVLLGRRDEASEGTAIALGHLVRDDRASTIAIVIPCRNEQAHIGALLDAIAAQTRQPEEVIVVDDQSTDHTRRTIAEWCTAHPPTGARVRVVAGAGRGPGPAMNIGISVTSADIIVRLDGHCIPEPQYVERSCRALERPGAGVVGGVWRVVPGAPTQMARAIAAVVSHPVGSGGVAYRHADRPGPVQEPVDTVPFGAYRRQLWQRLGGYDESLEANQDYDFNYRTRQLGLQVLLDRKVVATYASRPSLRALWRQYSRYGYWKAQMLRKDPRALTFRQIPPMLLLPWLTSTVAWWAASMLMPMAPQQAMYARAVVVAYPSVVLAIGLHAGLTRRVLPLSAASAFATVHLAWSLGIWRGILSVRPENSR